jgi:prepilin peptidase CpaA
MAITAYSAWWFLPFVLPVCLFVCYTDLSMMRITNKTVLLLGTIFVLVGLIAMPSFDAYLWRLAQMVIVLIFCMVLNAAGAMGGGDAKFIAAASPFIAIGDLRLVIALLSAALLAAVVTHRFAKHTALRRLAPDWVSWDKGKKFPMGLALSATLAIYLGLGTQFGA